MSSTSKNCAQDDLLGLFTNRLILRVANASPNHRANVKKDTKFVLVSLRRAKNLGRRGNVRGKSFKNTPNHISVSR